MRVKTTILLLVASVLLSAASLYGQSRKSKTKKHSPSEQEYIESADFFARGLIEKSKGDLASALVLFDKALAINPDDDASWYERSLILQQTNRNDEALEAIKKAIELNEENKWYLVAYARICKITENYNEYVEAYEKLSDAYPTDLDFLNELAFAYYFTGDYTKAIEAYNRIEKEVGLNESLTTQKVSFYEKLNQPEKGIEEFDKLIDNDPTEPRYHALMAEFCARNGFDDRAIAAYEKIVELNPDDPYVHISLADYYNKKGNTVQSFEELKKGFSNTTLDLKTKINLLLNYYQGNFTAQQKIHALELSELLRQTHPEDIMSEIFYASMLYENEEYVKARPIFLDILKEQASNYSVWEQLLFCDLNLQDFAALANDSENAIDYFPNYPLPYLFAGLANSQLKDYVKAQAYLESGIQFVVNNNTLLEQFHSTLGDTYHAMGDQHKAFDAYEKVLKINPENALVLNNYAYYLSLESLQLDKAAGMAKKAVSLDPYNSNNLDTYAWVLYKLGKYDEALVWIEKAYNNKGNSSGVVLEHYGDILFKLNRHKEALEFWEQAAQKDGGSALLKQQIQDKKLYE